MRKEPIHTDRARRAVGIRILANPARVFVGVPCGRNGRARTRIPPFESGFAGAQGGKTPVSRRPRIRAQSFDPAGDQGGLRLLK